MAGEYSAGNTAKDVVRPVMLISMGERVKDKFCNFRVRSAELPLFAAMAKFFCRASLISDATTADGRF
jgi:hypothetical protein